MAAKGGSGRGAGALGRYVCSLSPFETAREARNTENVPSEHRDDSMVPTEPR